MNKEYLGDGVYVEATSDMITLTVEDGTINDPGHEIFLEPEVLIALIRYAQRAGIFTTPVTFK